MLQNAAAHIRGRLVETSRAVMVPCHDAEEVQCQESC